MSEKHVTPIKTLARYEPDTVYIGTGEYVAECVRADDGDYYLAADADAAIEALQAEIERLREQLRLSTVDQVNAEAEANDARAEIEALRAELDESCAVGDKLARLLAETAIVIKGPEPDMTKWSYHDIPDGVRAIQARAERLEEERDELVKLVMEMRGTLRDLRIHLHAAGRRPEECYEMSMIDDALHLATMQRTTAREMSND